LVFGDRLRHDRFGQNRCLVLHTKNKVDDRKNAKGLEHNQAASNPAKQQIFTSINRNKKISHNRAMPGMAIVAEGGGQRGIFTAGVLDAFIAQSFNPFSVGVGVSAGAQNLLTYFMNKSGHAAMTIAALTRGPSFLAPYRRTRGRSLLDLDRFFEQIDINPQYSLPINSLEHIQRERALYFVATERNTLRARYLRPDAREALMHLKASSAIPFLYREGVAIANTMLIDGSVADPLPIRFAYSLGATQIVLIRTVPSGPLRSTWFSRINWTEEACSLPKHIQSLLGDARPMLDTHSSRYNDALSFINAPPADLSIYEVSPDKELESSRLASSSRSLKNDYRAGRLAGERVVDLLSRELNLR